jgi:hypothetical protein
MPHERCRSGHKKTNKIGVKILGFSKFLYIFPRLSQNTLKVKESIYREALGSFYSFTTMPSVLQRGPEFNN